jgi:hypothetical protein
MLFSLALMHSFSPNDAHESLKEMEWPARRTEKTSCSVDEKMRFLNKQEVIDHYRKMFASFDAYSVFVTHDRLVDNRSPAASTRQASVHSRVID